MKDTLVSVMNDAMITKNALPYRMPRFHLSHNFQALRPSSLSSQANCSHGHLSKYSRLLFVPKADKRISMAVLKTVASSSRQ